MSMTMAWDRIVGLVDATSGAIRTVAFVSMAAGAIVLIGLMRSDSVSVPVAVLFGFIPLLGPGALIWDFSHTLAKLPRVPAETIGTATEALRSTGSVVTNVTADSNVVARIIALLRGLLSARSVIGNLKSLGVAAWWLKRLASPLYLLAVAGAVAWSVVLGLLAVVVLVALV